MAYAAIINVPGYLPEDDDPQLFETPREAWECLADRVEVDIQDLPSIDGVPQAHMDALAELVTNLRLESEYGAPGTVYGPQPGHWGEHSLGFAYNVQWVEEGASDE